MKAMLEIIEQLRAFREYTKDNNIVALLFCSFAETYANALETRPKQELTPIYVKLIEEFDRRKENMHHDDKDVQRHKAQDGNQSLFSL